MHLKERFHEEKMQDVYCIGDVFFWNRWADQGRGKHHDKKHSSG
jgi:hypothetical protein